MGKQGIGTLNEKPLHASLKQYVAQEGDEFEVGLEGFVIDVVRGDRLIEIQTRNLGAMKRKLTKLLPNHAIHLYHPISATKWLIKTDKEGKQVSGRRRSPKKGQLLDVFGELVRIPHLATHENLTVTVLLIEEEVERRLEKAKRSRWRKETWQTHERRLLHVLEAHTFSGLADYVAVLPSDLPEQFTTADLSSSLKKPRRLAQQICYCLRAMGGIEQVDKRGNAIVYKRLI